LGAFWRKLDEQGAHVTTIAATKLLMLTMTRKSELLRSKWPEFDLDAAQWDLPAERMKMGKPHRVFLSRQAVEILRKVHELTSTGQALMCIGLRAGVRQPLTEAASQPMSGGHCESRPTTA